jgi:AcrR family transcriptional regulator
MPEHRQTSGFAVQASPGIWLGMVAGPSGLRYLGQMVVRKTSSAPTSGIESRRKAALSEGNAGYTARRAEIIKVAADVFRERGYDAATLNDVASRLGTDRASLYYYVRSKEELLQEIVRDVLSQNLEAAERVRKQKGTAPEKLQALIEHMIESFDRTYPHMYVYLEDIGRIARQDSEWARDVVTATKKFESIVGEVLKQGRKDGSLRSDLPLELCSFGLFGMINWTHRWYRPGSKYTAKEIAAAFSAMFLEGCGTEAKRVGRGRAS